jgi:hypothetical protein
MEDGMSLEDATLRFLEVPLICGGTAICDRASFFDWPEKQQWEWSVPLSPWEVAARAQSWLYAGLLSICFEQDLVVEDFTRLREDGRTVVDASKIAIISAVDLSKIPKAGGQEDASITPQHEASSSVMAAEHLPYQNWDIDMGHAVEKAKAAMSEVILPALEDRDDSQTSDLFSSEPHAVLFSVDILICLLKAIIHRKDSPTSNQPWEFGPRDNASELVFRSRAISRSALAVGRCPSLAWRLRPSSIQWAWLLCQSPCNRFRNHTDCSRQACSLYNVDLSTYRSEHAGDCLACHFVGIDEQALADMIEEGALPLVSCNVDSAGSLHIEIVRGDLQADYVAISHVWAGGMGNPRANALPECRLKELHSMIEALPAPNLLHDNHCPLWFPLYKAVHRAMSYEQRQRRQFLRNRKILFWLDTLCVPVNKKFAKHRQLAIGRMAQTYAGARQVLVLDPDLQQIHVPSAREHVSYLPQIGISSWMARSWTFQEGGIAPELYVRFANRLVGLDEDDQTSLNLPQMKLLNNDIIYGSGKSSDINHFCRVWNALAIRTTTQPFDIPAILATLLNLSADEILSQPTGERMRSIIRSQTNIPLTMLYVRPTTASLVQQEHTSWLSLIPHASITEGHMDKYYGLLNVTDHGFIVHDTSQTFMLECDEYVDEGTSIVLAPCRQDEAYRIMVKHLGHSKSKQKATAAGHVFMLSRHASSSQNDSNGALFAISNHDDKELRLKFKAPVRWQKISRPENNSDLPHSHYYSSPERMSDYVIIEEDVQAWHKPQWTRMTAYPFLNYHSRISMVQQTLAIYSMCFTHFSGRVLSTFFIGRAARIAWLPIIRRYAFLLYARQVLYLCENVWWDLDVTEFLRQRWAATFYDCAQSTRALRTQYPPMFMTLRTQAPLFLVAIGLLITRLCSNDPGASWMTMQASILIVEPFVRCYFSHIVLKHFPSSYAVAINYWKLTVVVSILMWIFHFTGWRLALWASTLALVVFFYYVAVQIFSGRYGRWLSSARGADRDEGAIRLEEA